MPDTTAEDDFGSFFDDLGRLAAEKKPIPADFGATPDANPLSDNQPVAADTTQPVAAEQPVADTTQPVADTTQPVAADTTQPVAADPVVAPADRRVDAVAPAPRTEDVLARLADVLDRRTPPAPQPTPQPQPAPRLYTDEEVGVLNTFQKDWPDVAAALNLMLRGATVQNQQQIFSQLGEVLGPQLRTMQAVSVDHQYNSLRAAIPDYDQVADRVIQWARTDKTIPPFLRNAYEGVIQSGDVGEIKHLVDTWRTATPAASVPQQGQNPAARQAAPATRKVNELSEAAKQAAASLAPVVSQRTAVVTTATPPDFDGAFDHWSTPAKA